MKEIVKAVLIETDWGRAIRSENIPGYKGNKEFAFLDYYGNCRDFEVGREYTCEVIYKMMYPLAPDKAAKNWNTIERDSVEEIFGSEEYIKFKRNSENMIYLPDYIKNPGIQPYFRIIQ